MNRVRGARELSDASEKLANMTIGSRKPNVVQRPPVKAGVPPVKSGAPHSKNGAPLLKAGVQWVGESGDVYLRPVHHIQPGRAYTRKVVG